MSMPIHPRSNLTALGFRKDGRPIWPIRGAEDAPPDSGGNPPADPPNPDPPAGDKPDSGGKPGGDTPPDDKGFPESTPLAQMTAEQREAYWKHQARKHEQRARERADYDDLKAKAAKLDEIEAANKSELEKEREARQRAEEQAKTLAREKLRSDVAAAKGVPAGLLSGSTKEELEASADQLLEFRGEQQKPPPDFGGGQRGEDVGSGVKQWTKSDLEGKTPAQIEEARKAGNLDRLMGKSS